MTVCIAAICENSNTILGASDRMLTAGNVQFQPPNSKTFQLTSSIALMVSGDMALQAEIISELKARIWNLIRYEEGEKPPDWLVVKDVALIYAEVHRKIRTARAETEILAPLGLTSETFISRQKELSTELVNTISIELIGKTLPNVSAIVAGIDLNGAHLFVVNDGEMTCQDAVGFAAIGAGWYHASSHLMFSRHDYRNGTLGRTLLLTYTAKKRAEVAPGVGIETDMFSVRGIGNFFEIGTHVVEKLQSVYETAVTGHKKVDDIAERKANGYLEEIAKSVNKPEQANKQTSNPATPVDAAGKSAGEDGQ